MLFSMVKVALTLIFARETSSTGLVQEQSISTRPAYYDCGSWIVYEDLLQNMFHEERINIKKMVLPFKELIYDLKPNFWKMNIPESLYRPNSIHRTSKRPQSHFYLIIGHMEQFVDVVAEMKNGHYIKCKRVDKSMPEPKLESMPEPKLESMPEPSNLGPNDYGYECGHDLFSHATVQMSADLARSKKFRNKIFHIPYQGPLYWPGIDYSIYPLSREKYHHYAGKNKGLTVHLGPENTYFVVISPAGKILDVVAQLKSGDFMKCDRTTKVPPDVESDQDLRLGYLCGLEF
ncbi:hypothetical protein EPUL_005821, partial [Erysiphe pulchra]